LVITHDLGHSVVFLGAGVLICSVVVERMLPVVVGGAGLLLKNTLAAYPTSEDIAIAQLVEKFALEGGFKLGIAFVAETHQILVLPGAVEMRATDRVAGVGWLARIVATFLKKEGINMRARGGRTSFLYLANIDATFSARQSFYLALGVVQSDLNRFVYPNLALLPPDISAGWESEVLTGDKTTAIAKTVSAEHVKCKSRWLDV
jgi:hypothetical protein